MLSELRQAIRLHASQPMLAAIAVTTIALGTGANTAIFSVVNAVLLRPLSSWLPTRRAAGTDPVAALRR